MWTVQVETPNLSLILGELELRLTLKCENGEVPLQGQKAKHKNFSKKEEEEGEEGDKEKRREGGRGGGKGRKEKEEREGQEFIAPHNWEMQGWTTFRYGWIQEL